MNLKVCLCFKLIFNSDSFFVLCLLSRTPLGASLDDQSPSPSRGNPRFLCLLIIILRGPRTVWILTLSPFLGRSQNQSSQLVLKLDVCWVAYLCVSDEISQLYCFVYTPCVSVRVNRSNEERLQLWRWPFTGSWRSVQKKTPSTNKISNFWSLLTVSSNSVI